MLLHLFLILRIGCCRGGAVVWSKCGVMSLRPAFPCEATLGVSIAPTPSQVPRHPYDALSWQQFQMQRLQDLRSAFLVARIPTIRLLWNSQIMPNPQNSHKQLGRGRRVCVTCLCSQHCELQWFLGCGAQHPGSGQCETCKSRASQLTQGDLCWQRRPRLGLRWGQKGILFKKLLRSWEGDSHYFL